MNKLSIEEALIEQFRRIREYKLLTLGILIGIIGSLIAGIINDLTKNTFFYPWMYLSILIVILLTFVFIFLTPYFNWKRFQYKLKVRMREIKEGLDMVEAHRKKYPVKKVDSN